MFLVYFFFFLHCSKKLARSNLYQFLHFPLLFSKRLAHKLLFGWPHGIRLMVIPVGENISIPEDKVTRGAWKSDRRTNFTEWKRSIKNKAPHISGAPKTGPVLTGYDIACCWGGGVVWQGLSGVPKNFRSKTKSKQNLLMSVTRVWGWAILFYFIFAKRIGHLFWIRSIVIKYKTTDTFSKGISL